MTRCRQRLLAVVTVLGSLSLCLLAAEAVLQLLPVATGMRAMPVVAESPVFRFTPNRDFLFSRDWDMAMANRGHVNNAGFVNDQDYRGNDQIPLLAVVGDSYIEAAMVPYAATMHGRLAKQFAGQLRVYSFAASGAPLSQYLVWARHAVREYGAQALVINVVANDFDESLADYRIGPGFWHYVRQAGEGLELRLFEYRPTHAKQLLIHSALARYLEYNLQIKQRVAELRSLLFDWSAQAAPRYAGNTWVEASPARVTDSLLAIDAFFRDLADLVPLPAERVTFTIDGFRYPESAAAGADSYFDLMRRAFSAKAEMLGYEVVDLDPLFFARHAETAERYEYPRDGHWNPAGHAVAFEAVMASRLIKSMAHSVKQGSGGKAALHVQ